MTVDELDELFYEKTGWRDVVTCPEDPDYPCCLCPYQEDCRDDDDDDEIPF